MSEAAANPYAAPVARVDDVAADPAAEAIRREHINHEASIKAVGFLYYLGGAGFTLYGLFLLSVAFSTSGALMIGLLALAIGVGQLLGGWGVRALRPWGRAVGAVISALGLLGFPIGTLINAYILYLYFSKKGGTIFSPEYQQVIAATPHVKYKTSIVVWIFLGLIGVLLLIGIGAAVFGK